MAKKSKFDTSFSFAQRQTEEEKSHEREARAAATRGRPTPAGGVDDDALRRPQDAIRLRAGQEHDGGDGLPNPARIRLNARRATAIAEAKVVLAHLPEPGESLHAICTARMDLTDVIGALVERMGRCEKMMVATLGYNRKNLRTILGWLDQDAVGSLSLVASKFFRSHNGDLWTETLAEFHERKQRAACCDSHAKVVTMHFASGARLAIEGRPGTCAGTGAVERISRWSTTRACTTGIPHGLRIL